MLILSGGPSIWISHLMHNKHLVPENLIGGSSIISVSPLVEADSEQDMPGIKPRAPRLVHQRSDHWATSVNAGLAFGLQVMSMM